MSLKRLTALLSAGCLMAVCCTGCKEEQKPVVSMYDLSRAMLAADDTLPDMSYVSNSDENASELFGYLSDMDYALVESYFLSYSSEGLADEIAVIAVKDAADVETAKKSIEAHVEDRVGLYTQYDPSQTERAEDALVFTSGQYAVLIISEKQDEVKTAFEGFIEE